MICLWGSQKYWGGAGATVRIVDNDVVGEICPKHLPDGAVYVVSVYPVVLVQPSFDGDDALPVG